MIYLVDFWPRLKAEAFSFTPNHAVISITDPGQLPAVISGTQDILRLEFLDLEAPVDHPNYKETSLFGPAYARALDVFVRSIHGEPGKRHVIAHCEAGVSRSAAVALFVEAATNCDFLKREQADDANRLVVQVMAETTGVDIELPAIRTRDANSPIF